MRPAANIAPHTFVIVHSYKNRSQTQYTVRTKMLKVV